MVNKPKSSKRDKMGLNNLSDIKKMMDFSDRGILNEFAVLCGNIVKTYYIFVSKCYIQNNNFKNDKFGDLHSLFLKFSSSLS